MIVCQNCSKENQDHYKFCLGCGAELRRDKVKPKPTAPTPPSGFTRPSQPDMALNLGAASRPNPAAMTVPDTAPSPVSSLPAQPSQPAVAPSHVSCPRCGTSNPSNFKFCGSCGSDLQAAASAHPPAVADPPAPVVNAPAPSIVRGSLVRINPDGSEGERIELGDEPLSLGRSRGGILSDDAFLSPAHATFRFEQNRLVVKDEDSLNGVWVRIEPEEPRELEHRSQFRIGQEILEFEVLQPVRPQGDVEAMGSPSDNFLGRVSLVVGRESRANSVCVPSEGLHLGRERGDAIFPEDGYVSGLHCRLHGEEGRIFVTDLGSSNGTYIRVKGEEPVAPGTSVLMGQQIYRVDY